MATVVLPEATRALYPFKSHFLTLSDGKRMHYLDEGPEDGEVLVLVHGYPTWSFLYRALVVYYAAQGFRCIAIDHIGCGMSDKPTRRQYHTLRRHIHNLMECLQVLGLTSMTLIVEGWGGPVGLGYAVRYPERIKRLVIMNSWAFQDTYTQHIPSSVRLLTWPGVGELLLGSLNLAVSTGIQRLTVRRLSATVLAGYRMPFVDARSRVALVQFPRLISLNPAHPSAPQMREIEQGLTALGGVPTLILWGRDDPLLELDLATHWKRVLGNARGPVMIDRAGHFLLEDDPEAVINQLDLFFEKTG